MYFWLLDASQGASWRDFAGGGRFASRRSRSEPNVLFSHTRIYNPHPVYIDETKLNDRPGLSRNVTPAAFAVSAPNSTLNAHERPLSWSP